MGQDSMKIVAACHCTNIRCELQWPVSLSEIGLRECGCTFCRKHGAVWTSHRDSELSVVIDNFSLVSKYKFGTATAEFYVCSLCGVVPFAISNIENRLYAVVNVNTFKDVDPSMMGRVSTDFDAEETDERLQRRQRTWIPDVRISTNTA